MFHVSPHLGCQDAKNKLSEQTKIKKVKLKRGKFEYNCCTPTCAGYYNNQSTWWSTIDMWQMYVLFCLNFCSLCFHYYVSFLHFSLSFSRLMNSCFTSSSPQFHHIPIPISVSCCFWYNCRSNFARYFRYLTWFQLFYWK